MKRKCAFTSGELARFASARRPARLLRACGSDPDLRGRYAGPPELHLPSAPSTIRSPSSPPPRFRRRADQLGLPGRSTFAIDAQRRLDHTANIPYHLRGADRSDLYGPVGFVSSRPWLSSLLSTSPAPPEPSLTPSRPNTRPNRRCSAALLYDNAAYEQSIHRQRRAATSTSPSTAAVTRRDPHPQGPAGRADPDGRRFQAHPAFEELVRPALTSPTSSIAPARSQRARLARVIYDLRPAPRADPIGGEISNEAQTGDPDRPPATRLDRPEQQLYTPWPKAARPRPASWASPTPCAGPSRWPPKPTAETAAAGIRRS